MFGNTGAALDLSESVSSSILPTVLFGRSTKQIQSYNDVIIKFVADVYVNIIKQSQRGGVSIVTKR